MPALSSGQHLDRRFTLVRRLDRRGDVEVWLVHDAELGEQVVARILPSDATDEQVELLRRACRRVRHLAHPGIARVFEFHHTGDRVFVTSEFVEGHDLSALLGRPFEELLPLAISIAGTLVYAHSRGVVRGALGPAGVLIDASGRPRLVGCGLGGSGGGGPADAAALRPSDDVRSLGALLYELASGQPPPRFDTGETGFSEGDPARFSGRADLPEGFRTLVLRMLAERPEDRPRDMASVEAELERIRSRTGGSGLAEAAPSGVNPPPRVKTIEPIPVAGSRPRGRSGQPRSTATRAVWTVVMTVAAVAPIAFVFFVLPLWAPSPVERSEAPVPAALEPAEDAAASLPLETPDSETAPGQGEDLQERAYREQQTEQALGRWIELKDDFERRGAAAWGGETWLAAVRHADSGDDRLAAGDHAAAYAEYTQAIELMEQLGGVAVDVLRRALTDGEQALDDGDEARATAAFSLAAKIAPDNQAASSGLRRAEVVEQVAELLIVGAARERAGEWVEAEQAYERAVALDPLSLVAQQSLARVQARVSDDRFAGLMSRGLAALHQGEYSQARAAFEQAGSLRPDSTQVADALLQVDQAETLDAFAVHRARAKSLEAAERWEEAAEQYEAVVRLAPNVAFARQGEERCRYRADLARRIAYHLEHPRRLSSDEVLTEARALLAEASGVDPAGPRHREQVAALEGLLATAGTFVKIRLESDNLTEVAIYRVGRLGAFLEREIELRPGTYTVVGSRKGYRDVRYELEVVAGETPQPLVVRCEEKIAS